VHGYKCLRPGRVGPFSGHTWPVGGWVEGRDPALCVRGVHACRVEDLPYWLTEELWEVELDGELRGEGRKLVAERGRLLRRIEGWTHETAISYGEGCAARARDRGAAATGDTAARLSELAADVAGVAARGEPALAGYIAARAAEVQAGVDGYAEERAAQAHWLASELGLVRA
jgi:hypothetical protein